MIRARRTIQLLGGFGLLFLALLGMIWGLVLLWVILGGALMLRFRDFVRDRIRQMPQDWRVKFVVLATALALAEEVVTVGMTNLAPLFGVKVGEAYITASANYLDVVLLHSVIVFIPMFIGWAWLLKRYDFSPNAVFLLFGITGTLAETISFGLQSLIGIGFWTYVYGLMIYLPVYSIPGERNATPPRFYHYLLALVFPILCAIPVAIVIGIIHPVGIHFDPM